MSITYVIRFRVRPERLEDFHRLLGEVLDAMRHEDTFHHAVLHEDPEDPCHLLLYETWADHDEVMNVQLHRPYRQAGHKALPDLLAAPREVTLWRTRRTDGQLAQPPL